MTLAVSRPAFVGREVESARVDAALAEARGGRRVVVLVAGEAGVGKSRFVEAVSERASHAGMRVLTGHSLNLGAEGLPFAPIVAALRDLATKVPRPELEAILGNGRADLAPLMPGVDLGPRPTDGPDDERFDQSRIFEHLLLALRRLAAMTPVVVVIEDLHWADRSTLELIGFLDRNLGDAAVVLVGTYRSDDVNRRHPLLPVLAELARGRRLLRIDLRRFDRRETGALVDDLIGPSPDHGFVDEVYARSGGNAFFAQMLATSGDTSERLSETLRDVLLERLALISEPTQELLRMAAAAGSIFSTELLGDAGEGSPETVELQVREAIEAHLLDRVGSVSKAEIRFRHELVREAIYAELLPAERRRWHARFARLLEAESPFADDPTKAAALAYHEQASGDLTRALTAWVEAGLAAERMGALADAEAYFEHGVELWDRLPRTSAISSLDDIDMLTHAASAADGRSPARAVGYVQEALRRIDVSAEPTRAGLLHERLGEYAIGPGEHSVGLAALREAGRLVPQDPPSAARATVLASLGRGLFYARDYAAAIDASRAAVETARAVGEHDAEVKGLVYLGVSLQHVGNVEQGLATIREAQGVARDRGSVSGLAIASVTLAAVLKASFAYPEAIEVGLEADRFAALHGLSARWGAGALWHVAEALLAVGRWSEAAVVLERAASYAGAMHEIDIDEGLLVLAVRRGMFEDAARHAAKVVPLSPDILASFAIPGLVELALWQGDSIAARATLDKASAILDRHTLLIVKEVGWICSLGLWAEADIALAARSTGDNEGLQVAFARGAAFFDRMRAHVEEVATNRPFFLAHARAWLALCNAEMSRLRGASDPDEWTVAVSEWTAQGMPYYAAYSRMREAQAVVSGGGPRSRAADSVREAWGIAMRLGARPLLDKLNALAPRVGVQLEDRFGQPVGSGRGMVTPTAKPTRYVLTRRELEVLDLVAAGRSDREIAAALFISRKTVVVHVANIKGKLGADSRVEAVTRAIGLGLTKSGSISA